jgi:hypothetical protein
VSIDLEREQDPEVLRQAARLLEAENRGLVARVTELTKQLLAAQGKDRVALQIEIESLQAQLEKKIGCCSVRARSAAAAERRTTAARRKRLRKATGRESRSSSA